MVREHFCPTLNLINMPWSNSGNKRCNKNISLVDNPPTSRTYHQEREWHVPGKKFLPRFPSTRNCYTGIYRKDSTMNPTLSVSNLTVGWNAMSNLSEMSIIQVVLELFPSRSLYPTTTKPDWTTIQAPLGSVPWNDWYSGTTLSMPLVNQLHLGYARLRNWYSNSGASTR